MWYFIAGLLVGFIPTAAVAVWLMKTVYQAALEDRHFRSWERMWDDDGK